MFTFKPICDIFIKQFNVTLIFVNRQKSFIIFLYKNIKQEQFALKNCIKK